MPRNGSTVPPGLVSCLYQLKTKIPIDFDLVNRYGERKAALTHFKAVQKNDVIVYDRGYFSYAMLYFHTQHEIHAVFRLPSSTFNVIDEFMESDKTDQIVFIMPAAPSTKIDIKFNYPEIKIEPLQLRLVKYVFSQTTYVLGTTLIDRKYTINTDFYYDS